MSKVTLNNITGGYAAVDLLNENFDAIEAAFDNTLSRNGAVPNPMLADFDLNHKDILNGGEINAQLLVLNGQPVTPGTLNYNGVVKETQTATASQTIFNLTTITYSPLVNNLSVYVDGVYQNPSRYTETNSSTVTFSEGLHLGAVVDFVVLSLNQIGGTTSASNVTIDDVGNYYSSVLVEGALQEVGADLAYLNSKVINVKDFGAVGNDITDDADAFTDALNYLVSIGGGALFIPQGTYRIKSKIEITCDAQQHISIYGEGRYSSTLDFSTASDLGIYFESTSTIANQLPTFQVTNLGIITSHKDCGTAIEVVYASDQNLDASVYFADLFIGQNIDRVSDSGSNYGYWSAGIKCYNARNGEIRNLHFYGEMNVSPNTAYGVKIDGESTAFVISDSLFLEAITGVEATGTSEGLYLNNTDIVYCRYGARHISTSGAQPQFTAVGCSFNCANVGVWLDDVQQSVVADSLFYAASVLDTGTWPEWTGVKIEGTLSAFNKVLGCTFSKEIGRTGDTTTGIDFNQGAAYSATCNHFFGFSGNPLTYGIQVRSGVSNVKIAEDHIFSYVTSNVSNAGTTASIYQQLIQSGNNVVSTGTTISFPSTFNTNPTVVACHGGTNTAVNVTVSNITNSGFVVNHDNGSAANVQWIATGY